MSPSLSKTDMFGIVASSVCAVALPGHAELLWRFSRM